jgi:hypothetical protein
MVENCKYVRDKRERITQEYNFPVMEGRDHKGGHNKYLLNEVVNK